MKLVTRCPSCAVMFKVVPDQLRISAGWVRCGQCGVVFDAHANLQPDSADAAPAAVAPDMYVNAQLSAVAAQASPSKTHDTVVARDMELHLFHLSPNGQVVEEDSVVELEPEVAAALSSSLDYQPQKRGAFPSPKVQSTMTYKNSEAETRLPDIDLKHSFLSKPVRYSSAWHDMNAAWGVVVFLLGALLFLQIVVQERDQLVAAKPELKPIFSSLCAIARCKIGPLRQIESVVIDASSFVSLRPNVYRLNVTFRNTALVDVAIPALELTLTDTQDRSILRLVFSPKNLGIAQEMLIAGAELSASVAMKIAPLGTQASISGYRLVSFYP